ncbi:uncharacterized protein LOC135351819 [Halichondria panicea]|uniref:uncharacterized protein LOC135351819 n=1 Tax=Halichondria panicea TaxID=6063 RepID=UPI00312B396D
MVKIFKVILLFIVSLGSITLLWFYARLFFTTEPAELVNAIETNATETKHSTGVAPTRFIYLTQTENCIPTYLKSPEVIGDSKACQCDVIILSYKTKCADMSLPHVQYIFNSNKSITWTTGRNLLYEVAKKRKEKYIHYIFMDDDVQLIPVDKKNTQNPFRMYEESLKIFQPAVVVILDYTKRNYFPTTILPERLDCELTRYVQIYRIDGLFIAYHYQAIDYILPYVSKYDSVSWWYSQEYTNVRLNIRFNGQVVTDPRFRTPNPQHRDYQKRLPLQDAFNNFVADIRLEEPEKYRKSFKPILQQWLANDDPKWMLGQQTCERDLSVHPYRPYENLA